MNSSSRAKEPSTAPQAEQWYPFTLGSTLRDQSSTRFYNLRYEFKPASIDTSRPGSLHKSVDNKVTVEFFNNQAGKPKVSFQGNSEECKDLDAVIFFDGTSFRLERLHRAIKSLRHVRLPGESSAGGSAVGASMSSTNPDHPASPAHLNGGGTSLTSVKEERTSSHKGFQHVQVQVEEISIGQPEISEAKHSNKRKADANDIKELISSALESPLDAKSDPEHVDVDDVGEEDNMNMNMNMNKTLESHPTDLHAEEDFAEHESDFEIEDVNVSEVDGDGEKGGVNAAEALWAQAAAEDKRQESSSDSGSESESSGSGSGSDSGSGSGSGTGSGSGSGSGTSSSGSDASDDENDSASSGKDA